MDLEMEKKTKFIPKLQDGNRSSSCSAVNSWAAEHDDLVTERDKHVSKTLGQPFIGITIVSNFTRPFVHISENKLEHWFSPLFYNAVQQTSIARHKQEPIWCGLTECMSRSFWGMKSDMKFCYASLKLRAPRLFQQALKSIR